MEDLEVSNKPVTEDWSNVILTYLPPLGQWSHGESHAWAVVVRIRMLQHDCANELSRACRIAHTVAWRYTQHCQTPVAKGMCDSNPLTCLSARGGVCCNVWESESPWAGWAIWALNLRGSRACLSLAGTLSSLSSVRHRHPSTMQSCSLSQFPSREHLHRKSRRTLSSEYQPLHSNSDVEEAMEEPAKKSKSGGNLEEERPKNTIRRAPLPGCSVRQPRISQMGSERNLRLPASDEAWPTSVAMEWRRVVHEHTHSRRDLAWWVHLHAEQHRASKRRHI